MPIFITYILFLSGLNQTEPPTLEQLCKKFNVLNTLVRDGKANKATITRDLNQCLGQIKSQWKTVEPDKGKWAFPMKGFGIQAVGGKNGNGYLPNGYRYLDGNKHGGHPAHDIFIPDKNQDGNDDRTGKPVEVLAVMDGVVVGIETQWKADSPLRGGKYVLVYHPDKNLISYYAHFQQVDAVLGNQVAAGDRLGWVGRTGLNAWKKRSPTHLHLMVLKVDTIKGLLPYNPYRHWK